MHIKNRKGDLAAIGRSLGPKATALLHRSFWREEFAARQQGTNVHCKQWYRALAERTNKNRRAKVAEQPQSLAA